MGTFKDLKFPSTYKYSSDSENIPLEFYENVFPISRRIDLFLGYFSSNAIKVLSESFAEFLFRGGSIRIVTNHVFSLRDKENLIDDSSLENEDKIIDIFTDIKQLENELGEHGKHFFDCLKYLKKHNRLTILPVKFNQVDLAHSKIMILFDGENYISTDGSINFTLPALTKNMESFEVNAPWKGEIFEKRVIDEIEKFEKIITKRHNQYTYISPDQIETVIDRIGKEKDILDLLDDSINLPDNSFSRKVKAVKERRKIKFREIINDYRKSQKIPLFPFPEPFQYQKEAYERWTENCGKGLFAMATGTGKTLTALYCLIKEFDKSKIQKNIIIVPGEELVRQWAEELMACNFSNVFLWYSKNKRLQRDKRNISFLKDSNAINIVITYDSFILKSFQSMFSRIMTDYIVVFDEAHNIGATGFKNTIKKLEFNKVIGLSATPLRMWDEDNDNQFIEDLFKSYYPNYTFVFPMKQAIESKYLCSYHYYPFFSELTDDEFEEYLRLTRKIPFGADGRINSHAAIKRQFLLDRATNKSTELLKIIKVLVEENRYKYTLVYCPKGIRDTDESGERIIHSLGKLTAEEFKHKDLNIQFFVGETKSRDLLLKEFEGGAIDMLFAIKCLDEGINIPITQNAIFLASGKNYREFVQRRGRILRKFENEVFKKEYANIYDIVVLPSVVQFKQHENTAKKMIVNEFRRLVEFYRMAIPNSKTVKTINEVLAKYGLTLYYIEYLIDQENG